MAEAKKKEEERRRMRMENWMDGRRRSIANEWRNWGKGKEAVLPIPPQDQKGK
jgi:hypothetical protein